MRSRLLKNPIFWLSLVLILLPIVQRHGLYYLGGDDMRLYYVFPREYLENFSYNLITGNTLAGAQTGYNPVSYFAPFFYVVFVLKSILPVNVQSFMYGLNLALGLVFFIKLFGLLTDHNKEGVLVKIAVGVIYIFSPFLMSSLLRHQMVNMYLISTMPAAVYFFLLAIKKRKFGYCLMSVLIVSIFTTTLNVMPWLLGFLLGALPILVFFSFKHIKTAIGYALASIVVFMVVNFYWIFHLIYPLFFSSGNTGAVNYFASEQLHSDNLRIIRGVARLFEPIDILLLNTDQGVKPGLMDVPQIIFFLVIILAGIYIFSKKKKLQNIYSVLVGGYLLSWFLYSPNIGNSGPELFVQFVNKIPFFTMFRNMQDKFALPLALNFALLFGLSFSVINKVINKKKAMLLALTLLILLVIRSPEQIIKSYQNTEMLHSGNFENDFSELIDFIDQTPNESRFVWLPLNFPTYVNVADAADKSRLYSGLSPVRVLTGRDDLTGTFSFMTDQDLFLGYELFESIEQKDYSAAGILLRDFDIDYVILHDQDLPNDIARFMYGGEGLPLLDMQDQSFINSMIGDRVATFGSYEVYNINENYSTPRMFVQDQQGQETSAPEYNKLQDGIYSIALKGDVRQLELTVVDPYSPFWEVRSQDRSLKSEISRAKRFGYKIKLSSDERLPDNILVFFKPKDYDIYIYTISTLASFGSLLYIINMFRRN